MKFAIIAAGEGSRLKEEGINTPKPLVEVGGEKLIERLVRIFMRNGAEEIAIICNDLYPEVAHWLEEREAEGLPLTHIVKTTPSSMHSFANLSRILPCKDGCTGKFILTTVDTIFDEEEFSEYVKAFEASSSDAMMAVTDYIDDEKPLYVSLSPLPPEEVYGIKNGACAISGFLDTDPEHECQYISAGIYGLTDKALQTLDRCMREGKSRMRNFQRALLEDGLKVTAYPIGKVFDIDHKVDIDKANMLIIQLSQVVRS